MSVVHENLPVHVDVDDLVHACVWGRMDAVGKFDASKNVAFQAYAKHRIKGAFLDSLRELDWALRDMAQGQKRMDAVTRELSMTLGRTHTEQELAKGMGVEVDGWRRC